MMRKHSIAEKARQHRKCTHCECLVDERFLTVQCLDSRTTGQRIFATFGVNDLWIQLADGAQPDGLPAIARVQRLAQDELAAGGIVAEIEPVRSAVPGLGQRARNDASRCSGVHAANQ